MDIRDLKILIAIADSGSFAAAGDAMGLTQSAISLRIKALEDDLGQNLFDRTKRPLALNAHGEIIVGKAREIVDLYLNIKQPSLVEPVFGVLNLGAIPTVLTSVLPIALASMKTSHPNLLIKLTSGLSTELISRVKNGELDVAIIAEPTPITTGLRWQPYSIEQLVVIAPPDTPQKSDRQLLETLPFIRFQRFTNVGKLIDSKLRERNIKVQHSMEIDTLEGIALMVSHGLGVSIVPKRDIDKTLFQTLTIVPFCEPPIERTLGIIEKLANPKAHIVNLLFESLLQASGNSCMSEII